MLIVVRRSEFLGAKQLYEIEHMNSDVDPTKLSKHLRIRSLEDLPTPACMVYLHSGEIVSINKSFARFFGFEPEGIRFAQVLYPERDDRARWIERLTNQGPDPLQCEMVYLDVDGKRRVVIESSQILNPDDAKPVVLATMTEIGELKSAVQELKGQLDVAQQVLNLADHLGIFVTVPDEDGGFSIKWCSSGLQKLLSIEDIQSLKEPCDLLPESDRQDERRLSKLQFCGELNGRREHTLLLSGEGKMEPVQRREYLVKANKQVKQRWTAIESSRIPSDIRNILLRYGPHNPLLETVGVATFEKTFLSHASKSIRDGQNESGSVRQLVFTSGNAVFVNELIASGKIKSHQDILGRPDMQLFPDYSAKYSHVDRLVLDGEVIDQRTEEHTFQDSELATVLKAPIYTIAQKEPIGVKAFYWATKKSSEVFEALRRLYQPWEILNRISAPVYRKDRYLRFVYFNQAFLEDVRRVTGKPHLETLDVIGKTDFDLHPIEHATKYHDDDTSVLALPVGESISRLELHAFSDQTTERVFVEKTRIEDGIQGIFWFLKDFGISSDDLQINLAELQITAKDNVVCQFTSSQLEYLRLFDVLLRSKGAPVPFRKIDDQDGPRPLEKVKQNAAQRIKRLKTIMTGKPIDELLDIIAIPNEGYSIVLRSTEFRR